MDELGSGCVSNPLCVGGIIQSTVAGFVANIKTIDSELEAAGAKNLVVWNVPDLGKAFTVLAAGSLASTLGTTIAAAVNQALAEAIGSDPHLKLFDVFGLVNDAIADLGAFGLSNVTDACA